jgi:hypothetical protein
MNSEEIKKSPPGETMDDQNLWLKEIAYQQALRAEAQEKMVDAFTNLLGQVAPIFEALGNTLGVSIKMGGKPC